MGDRMINGLLAGAIGGASVLFRIPGLIPAAWQTVASDLVVAAVYGIVTAYALKRLDHPAVVE